MRYRAVLFDLDGTLVDSIPDIATGINGMLSAMGYPTLSTQRISTFLGKGMDHLIHLTLAEVNPEKKSTDDEFTTARTLFSKHYHAALEPSTSVLFPGVIEGLDAFKAANCLLAVVTNKPIEFVPALLKQMGIDSYFEVILGGNSCTEKKPHPMPFLHACDLLGVAPTDALVIGDSSNDSIAARRAGIDVLILPYGYNEGKNVQTLDCDGIVSSIVDAAQWAAKPNNNSQTP